MYNFVLGLHIADSVVLIIAILFLQTSKGSALSMFGGGGDALFSSPTGTDFVRKFTIGVSILFAATSLMLTVFASSLKMRSVVRDYPMQTAPAKPGQKEKAGVAKTKAESEKPASKKTSKTK